MHIQTKFHCAHKKIGVKLTKGISSSTGPVIRELSSVKIQISQILLNFKFSPIWVLIITSLLVLLWVYINRHIINDSLVIMLISVIFARNNCTDWLTFFKFLFGCPTDNFGLLSRGQPHSPDVNHIVFTYLTQRSLGTS